MNELLCKDLRSKSLPRNRSRRALPAGKRTVSSVNCSLEHFGKEFLMKAVYENDARAGAGYGRFRLEGLVFSARDEGATFALRRSGDGRYLNPQGGRAEWEEAEWRIAPLAVTVEEDACLLSVGPDIVRHLDELETYRLILFPASGPVEAAAEIAGVIYPPDEATARIAACAPPVRAAPAPGPAPEPVTEPTPGPTPGLASVPPAPAPAGKRSPALPALAAVIALALLAGGGYWLLRDAGPEQAAHDAAQAEEEKAQTPSDSPPQTPPESPPPQAQEPPPSPLEQARQFLRAPRSPEEGLDLSRRLPHTAEGRDAAFLLLGALAEQGQAEAMLELAAFYDPADDAPKGSIRPDAEQAWHWYAQAEQAGRAEATERKRRLREYLKAEAAGGSAEAREQLSRLP
jgi:hypothetical protein